MRWIYLLLAGALLLAPRGVVAGSDVLQQAVLPGGIFSSERMTPERRRHMAVGLDAYWLDVSNRIPRLSPSDKRWIEAEFQTSDSARLIRAMRTREGALQLALDTSEFCRTAYAAVVENLGMGATVEALAWVHSLRCYVSTAELPDHLHRAGLISRARTDAEIKMQLFSIWSQASLRVIEAILTDGN